MGGFLGAVVVYLAVMGVLYVTRPLHKAVRSGLGLITGLIGVAVLVSLTGIIH